MDKQLTHSESLKQKANLSPKRPGVYLMKDGKNNIIYIGKAKRLNIRLHSYFTGKYDREKTKILVSHIHNFEYIVTNNELEALILEANLIKKYKPRFNISLKDDKKYPFIKIDIKESFPKVEITRNFILDGAKYFGPYTDIYSLKQTLKVLNKIFPFRTCKRNIPANPESRGSSFGRKETSYNRPCLNYYIKKCYAPCIGKITSAEYKDMIKQVIMFLQGNTEKIIHNLKDKMMKASEKQKFEEAAIWRDKIKTIKSISQKQIMYSSKSEDKDIIGLAQEENLCCISLMKVRNGKLIMNESYFLNNTRDNSNAKILSEFIKQYYTNQQERLPQEILLETEPQDSSLISKWLKCEFKIPQRGDNKRFVKLAQDNAFIILENKKLAHIKSKQRTDFIIREMKDILRLPILPRKIAAFDISNIQGTDAVGSMVFFDNGKPKKKNYRHFKIKSVNKNLSGDRLIDDYQMMREVVSRYLSHLDTEEHPDLLLIDGGKGQLHFAMRAMKKSDYNIPIISLAKRLEEIFIPEEKNSIIIPKTSPVLKLLQRIRDEAHRFAITYHKKLRARKISKSELDDIRGIGEKRKLLLLKEFSSVEGIKNACLQDLQAVRGFNSKLAKIVYAHFHNK